VRRIVPGVRFALGIVCGLAGCASTPEKLVAPTTITAPYATSRGEVLWAVVPLRNESGTLSADPIMASDDLVSAVEQVSGVRAVPLNRTIEAMRALNMGGVRSSGDAKRLAQKMGVDGILVGTITAYDPYAPMMGLALALYARPGAMGGESSEPLDVRSLTGQTAESRGATPFADTPVSTVSEHLDANNHQVLMDLRTFAAGRADPESALGWKRYVKSMSLFSKFAAHHAVDELMRSEWTRLSAREHGGTPQRPRATGTEKRAGAGDGQADGEQVGEMR
jgi:hypothetical protein